MKRKIILTTHFTGGDVFPFIRIGKVLKERGHEVILCSHAPYACAAQEVGLEFVAWETPKEYVAFQKDMHKISDPLNHYEDWISFKRKYQNADQIIKEYDKIVDQISPEHTVIVARHRTSLSACFAAEKMKVPMVTVYLAPSYLTQLKIHEELYGAVLREEINEPRKQLGLPPVSSWFRYHASMQKNLGLWPGWFADQDATWPVPVELKGFPILNCSEKSSLPKEVNGFIGESKDTLLIAGGSSNFIDPGFFRCTIEACRLLKRKAILCTSYRELLPDVLPDHIFWLPSIPYPKILPSVSTVIHHGGMGTLSEALQAGVPQLILAHLTDGPDNASRLEKLGVAKFVPQKQWHPENVARSIEELDQARTRAVCGTYRKMINDTDMLSTIVDAIENAKDDPASVFEGENRELELLKTPSDCQRKPLDPKKKLEYQKQILLSRIKKSMMGEKKDGGYQQ